LPTSLTAVESRTGAIYIMRTLVWRRNSSPGLTSWKII
jgi:hypothetical protein